MVESKQRAEAAKERALAGRLGNDTHQTFRAVPVNVVAEPTLSMSVNTSSSERGRSPITIQAMGAKATTDSKKDFEPKETFQDDEKERKTSASSSNKALNRALQPRSGESPRAKDSGTKPPDSGTKPKPKESSYLSKFASAKFSQDDNKDNRGRLVGEIRQFGGSSGFSSLPTAKKTYGFASSPSPKKTPPKVAPKPVRSKSMEPPSSKPASSGLSKTLSSWKKSRAVSVSSKCMYCGTETCYT